MHIFKSAFSSKTYKRMFWRHYLQYALIFMALFFIAGLLFSYQARRQRWESAQQAAHSLSNYADTLMTECQRLAINIGQSESFLTLNATNTLELDFSQLDSTVFFTAQKKLVTFKALNRSIAALNVYLYDRQYIISDSGTMTLESFYRSVFNMDPNMDSEYLHPLNSGQFFFLPQGSIREAETPAHPLFVLSLLNNSGTRYGNLFLFLDERQIAEDLETLFSENMEYYLFDASGSLISGTVQTKHSTTGLLTYLKNDKQYFSSRNSMSGWTGYVGYSDSYLKHQMLLSISLFGGIFFVVILGLFPLTQAICSRNYAPIRELASIVEGKDADKEKELEYEALKKAISTVFENKTLLEEQILIYKPLLINSLLLELLNDTQSDYTIPLSGLENLGVSLPFSVYLCVSLSSDCAASDFLANIESIAEKIHSTDIVCHYISYQRYLGTLLLNCPDEKSGLTALNRLIDILEEEEHILEYGIGSMASDIKYASTSYDQSLFAMEYLSLDPLHKGISYDSIVQSGVQNHPRPASLNSMSVIFSAHRFEEAQSSLSDYFENAACGGFIRKSYLLYARDQLLLGIQRLQSEVPVPLDTDALKAYQIKRYGDHERLLRLCLDTCKHLEALSTQMNQEQVQSSSRQILNYIEDHLCEEDLSLSRLAEVFGQSESNMSRKIKQLTGSTFLSYVTQKRIDHARSLLSSTNMSVYNIAKASGYENDITFRRLFKKYVGVTPGEYRDQASL